MKSRKKAIFWCSVLVLVLSCFSGCKMVREVEIDKVNIVTPTPTEEGKTSVNPTVSVSPTQSPVVTMVPTENPVTIVVENGSDLNEEAILAYFYDTDKETLVAEGYLEELWYEEQKLGFNCDKNGVILYYTYEYTVDGWTSYNSFSIEDVGNGGASWAYERVCDLGYIGTPRFYEKFPEIDLESCSRAEAIEACASLAQICGYGDAQVNAYAVTESYLEEFVQYWTKVYEETGRQPDQSAPKPTYEYVSQRDIDKAREEGNEQLAKELENKPGFYECENVDWTKEHEAYIIVYRPILNGCILDSREYYMYCIYVPLYDSVVKVSVVQSLVAVEGKEETNLMTKDEAIAKAVRYLEIDSLEDITITGISMVYDTEYEKSNPGLEERTISPCWRIDYVLSERLLERPTYQKSKYTGTVVIDAVEQRVIRN